MTVLTEIDERRTRRGLPRAAGAPTEERSFAPAPQARALSQTSPSAHGVSCDPEGVQVQLAQWNRRRLNPQCPDRDWAATLKHDAFMQYLEGQAVEALREEVYDLAQAAPRAPEAFVAWFEALKTSGPGQGDPLFPWLAEHADEEQMCWFLRQEAAGEAGFDDLVALTQVKLPTEAKLELARNYWDEMGRGNAAGMHGPMLGRAIETLALNPTIETTAVASLTLANTMTAFATTRRYAWHSVGALGVVELTAPGRVAQVAAGLKRLGFPPVVRKYFQLHAVLDVQHSADWNANALMPLAREAPQSLPFIAEGALMRLLCGARCFEAYRRHFGLPATAAADSGALEALRLSSSATAQ